MNWTLVFLLCTMTILQLISFSSGTASYRDYRILTGYPDRSYYVNPFTYYKPNNPYSGKVYVTDKYGQTIYAGSAPTYATDSQYSRARALQTYECSTCGGSRQSLPLQQITTCSGSTCGNNAHCTTISGRPVCSCLSGYIGDPLYNCIRAECLENSECRGHLACINQRCVNPCESVCGVNAQCDVRNHNPVCSCPPGYTGNPFTQCRLFNPEELCHPSPCGVNTQCEVVNSIPTCKCLPGYHGAPLSGCRHECESNSECGPQYSCIEFKCQNPCSQCGTNAECEIVRNHVPVCKCPRNYLGNPLTACHPECTQNSDCPPGKPACFYNSCKNPCDNVCGINANCEVRNGITPVCSCPRDMTGNPFVSCRPFTKEDLCEPNPCGSNSKCQPGYDRANNERPVCTCLPGYLGNPLTSCIRGECLSDSECPDHQACHEYKCQNPCRSQCGINANCNARHHIAVCTCLQGYNGDALSQCHPIEATAVIPSRGAAYVSSSCEVCN